MTNGFQAKVKLLDIQGAPVSHTSPKNRTIRKNETVTITSKDEYEYYKHQKYFSIVVTNNKSEKIKKKNKIKEESEMENESEEVEDDEDEEENSEENEEDEPEVYMKKDLNRMSKKELRLLIKEDDELDLSLKDIPKNAGKKEIIDLILDAQE